MSVKRPTALSAALNVRDETEVSQELQRHRHRPDPTPRITGRVQGLTSVDVIFESGSQVISGLIGEKMTVELAKKAVVVAQMGARHNYAYARALEQYGILHALVTDYCNSVGGKQGFMFQSRLSSATQRRVVDISPDRLKSYSLVNFVGTACKLLPSYQRYAIEDLVLGIIGWRQCIGSDVIVNTFGNSGPMLVWAKSSGIKIVTDMIIAGDFLENEQREQLEFPGWELKTVSDKEIKSNDRKISHLLDVSDVVLCPSKRVAASLRKFSSFDESKCFVLPYPSPSCGPQSVLPELKRVLFAGTVCLRKGIQYLAAASKLLSSKTSRFKFVVAGADPFGIGRRVECSELEFLGQVSKDDMASEMARADVLCLPTVAEGSAGVIYEAIAYGVPVVTTGAAGSLIEDGVSGFVIPERDALVLAERIVQVCDNRRLRNEMSVEALQLAKKCGFDAWSAQLIAMIEKL